MQPKKRQKSVMRSDKMSFKESVMGACTNFMYKLGTLGGMKNIPKMLKKQQQFAGDIVILGNKYWNRIQALEKFQNVIWFTYRDRLKLTEDLNSDVGWGCLPRVGQMFLAQAITKHFEMQGKNADCCVKKQIISHFIEDQDHNESQYSLSNILKYARWKFNISPGEWFNIGQISDVLRKIQDELPMEGTQNLKIVFFSQSVIFKSEIVEKAGYNACSCQLGEALFCENCHKAHYQQQKIQQIPMQKEENYEKCSQSISNNLNNPSLEKQDSWNSDKSDSLKPYHSDQIDLTQGTSNKIVENQLRNHLALIVSVRVSQKQISQKQMQGIIKLLSLPSSIGAIGGVPSKAIYIIGAQNEEVVYLDPHFVQQFVSKKQTQEDMSSFFCKNYRTLSRKALDPSLAFCYYLKSMEEVQNFLCNIEMIKKELEDECFFISIMDDNRFTEQIKLYRGSSPFQNSFENRASFEYNSLEFRDIDDSY